MYTLSFHAGYVRPISIAASEPEAGETVRVAGWGQDTPTHQPDKLRKLTATVVRDQVADEAFIDDIDFDTVMCIKSPVGEGICSVSSVHGVFHYCNVYFLH